MSAAATNRPTLLRLLEEHPEWRADLRRVLLTEDLLALPESVAALRQTLDAYLQGQARLQQALALLAEEQQATRQELRQLAAAQRQTQEQLAMLGDRVENLVQAHEQTRAEVSQLAEALRHTQEELAALARRVDQLAAGLDELRQQVQALAKQVGKLTHRVDHLDRRVNRLEDRVGQLWGREVERRYRKRAAAYLGRWPSGVEVWHTHTLARTLDLAARQGRISPEEHAEALCADVVIRGEDSHGHKVTLVVEASSVVDANDVARALLRASLCQRALEGHVWPVVAGESAAAGVSALCQKSGVWLLLDGQLTPPAQAAQRQ